MKIKETICTEVDNRGRVIKRTRTVEFEKPNTDFGYDYATRYGECERPRQTSFDRIMDAYEDYRRCEQW